MNKDELGAKDFLRHMLEAADRVLRYTPLKRIVVGPGPHTAEWTETIKLLLAKNAISGVNVVPSEIPYRNW